MTLVTRILVMRSLSQRARTTSSPSLSHSHANPASFGHQPLSYRRAAGVAPPRCGSGTPMHTRPASSLRSRRCSRRLPTSNCLGNSSTTMRQPAHGSGENRTAHAPPRSDGSHDLLPHTRASQHVGVCLLPWTTRFVPTRRELALSLATLAKDLAAKRQAAHERLVNGQALAHRADPASAEEFNKRVRRCGVSLPTTPAPRLLPAPSLGPTSLDARLSTLLVRLQTNGHHEAKRRGRKDDGCPWDEAEASKCRCDG